MRTILIDMPVKVRGYIYEDVATGYQVCVLNSRLSYEANLKTYQHECDHITNDDFDSYEDINTIEKRAHALNN